MASLVWRKDRKQWYSYFNVESGKRTGRPVKKAPRREKISRRERTELQVEADKIQDEERGKIVAESEIDLETAAAIFLEDVQQTKAWRTHERYCSVMSRFVHGVNEGSRIPLRMMSERHIREFRDDRLKVVRLNTVRCDLKIIGRFFSWCRRQREGGTGDRWIGYNPVDDVELPALKNLVNKGPKPKVFPCQEEVRRLLEIVDENGSDEYRALAYLGAFAGMRRSEILELTWGCVDFTSGLLYVEGKSAKPRYIPMTKTVKELLGEIRGKRGPVNPEDDIFPSPATAKVRHRSPHTAKQFNKMLKNELNVEWRHHALRSFFVDYLARADGLTDAARLRVAGHESEDVNRMYQNPDQELVRPALELLESGVFQLREVSWSSGEEARPPRIASIS